MEFILLAMGVCFFGMILLNGLVKIPIVHKGALLVFGKRKKVVLDEGWHWLF